MKGKITKEGLENSYDGFLERYFFPLPQKKTAQKRTFLGNDSPLSQEKEHFSTTSEESTISCTKDGKRGYYI